MRVARGMPAAPAARSVPVEGRGARACREWLAAAARSGRTARVARAAPPVPGAAEPLRARARAQARVLPADPTGQVGAPGSAERVERAASAERVEPAAAREGAAPPAARARMGAQAPAAARVRA